MVGKNLGSFPAYQAEFRRVLGPEHPAELGLIGGNRPPVLHDHLVGAVAVPESLLLERGPEAGPELSIAEEAGHARPGGPRGGASRQNGPRTAGGPPPPVRAGGGPAPPPL